MTWYFSVKESSARPGRWVAMAKREPITGNGEPESEPGNIWSEYGISGADALNRLLPMLPGWTVKGDER